LWDETARVSGEGEGWGRGEVDLEEGSPRVGAAAAADPPPTALLMSTKLSLLAPNIPMNLFFPPLDEDCE